MAVFSCLYIDSRSYNLCSYPVEHSTSSTISHRPVQSDSCDELAVNCGDSPISLLRSFEVSYNKIMLVGLMK